MTENTASPLYTRGADDLPPGADPAMAVVTAAPDTAASGEAASETAQTLENDGWLLQKARQVYTESTDYIEANITNQWEKNLSHFHGQHAPGSAFNTKNYKRSRMFRPKTRSNVKKQEAALATALFATSDYVDIQPENVLDEGQKLSASIVKALLQYRLKRRMRWFQTVLGAWQDTKTYGVCFSHQYWRYEVDTDVVPALDEAGEMVLGENEAGEMVPMGRERRVVRFDALCCDNVAPENLRFSPLADWRDPIGTSPYLVYLMPIYVSDVLEQMEKEDPKTGRKAWRTYRIAEILSARRETDSRTRQAREGDNRVDPLDARHGEMQTMVWAHLNVIRINGEDMAWWTLGTELLLTDPVPLRKLYLHLKPGERPFVMGVSSIETHRNYPAGDVEQISGLQEELNTLVNQRIDNVKLALNKRYYVRRGSQIDLDSLIRNTPGGGVFMNDPERDIKTESFPDVTGSSYQEQDRLSLEADDLVGAISQQTAAQQRGPESAGKTNVVSQGANMVQDYSIQIFIETWMEPVLRQLVKLVQMYETDEALLALAGQSLQLFQRYGIDQITDSLLMNDLTLRVSVGMGNTDPVRRVERLVFGTARVMEIPGMAARVKAGKLADEIYGALGYRDSSAFFLTDAEAEEQAASNPPQPPFELQVKMRELDIREQDNNARHEREAADRELERELRLADLASRENITVEQLKTKLGIAARIDQTAREIAALKERNRLTQATLQRAATPIRKGNMK